ncbi:MAG: ATP-binding cassette domain-containing protein [Promethearchaeota archaeon]|jgi:ABC-type oligopeptide transport system ATPase subunit
MTTQESKTKETGWDNPSISKGNIEPIIKVKKLKTYYPILGGLFKRKIGEVRAVDGVTFNLNKHETLGLVGESGCGKTTIGNTILNLVKNTDGEIYYEDRRVDLRRIQGILERFLQKYKTMVLYAIPNIYQKNSRKIERIMSYSPSLIRRFYKKIKNKFRILQRDFLIDKFMRKKIQMVFQDPDASLNPRWKIVNIIGEPLRILEGLTKRREIRRRVLKLLEIVSMKPEHLDRYPHEFSGGQKQRIVIARALAIRCICSSTNLKSLKRTSTTIQLILFIYNS